MSVRQYIGARYVTKIYENTLDPSSAEWQASVNYEPLTMVTYNNGSYLSKKQVPASVGNPAANPTYWVQTGFYNGQILNLQNQIDAINAEISLINPVDRKYIVVCDSYGQHLNANNNNFYVQAFNDLGITDYYDFHRGSSGFSQSGTLNFLTVLTDNDTVITNKDEITDIIVAGGANDQGSNSDIATGISDFMTYVKANYPNAKVHIGHFTNSIEPAYAPYLTRSVLEYKKCGAYGASYIENSQYIMMRLSFFKSGAVHPSVDGVNALTKYFTEFILSDKFDVKEEVTASFADGSAATITTDTLIQRQYNGEVALISKGGGGIVTIAPGSSLSVIAGETFFDNAFTFTDGFCISCSNNQIAINCIVGNSTNWAPAVMFVRTIEAGKVLRGALFIYSQSAFTLSSITINGGQTTVMPW